MKQPIRQPKITLVELPPTSFGKLDGGKLKDIYTLFKFPARANLLLQSILINTGKYKDVESIGPHINSDDKLTKENFDRIFESDYLLLSSITRTIPQTKELAELYHKKNPNGKVIVGGHHATFLPEEVLKWADVVVRGEGDKTILELIKTFEEKKSLKGIKGISYKIGNKIFHEQDREFLTTQELSDLPVSSSQRIVNTSRGCPHSCNFCSVVQFFRRTYRRRTNDSIMNELKSSSSKSIFFGDDNFAANKIETRKLLERIISEGINHRRYSYQLDINSAFISPKENIIDEDFIKLLKKAGGFAVFLGLESICEETLKQYGKFASAERNKLAVNAFRDAGLWVHGMMILGSDADTDESLNETSKWARENLDSVQYFAPIPLPGTPLTKEMEKHGRIISKDYNLYDGFHVLMKPKNFSPYELQMKIIQMHRDFYSFKGNWKNIFRSPLPIYKLIIHAYAKKMTYDITHEPQTKKHIEFLKSLS